MQRYWSALDACARRRVDQPTIDCPIGAPVFPARRRSRFRRAWQRYIRYPLLVKARVRPGIVHLLDHSSAHLIGWLPPSCRIVVTVHDLIPLREGTGLSARQRRRFHALVSNLRNADRIVAVSRFTANDIGERLGIAAEKIRVVPNGVEAPRCSSVGSAADGMRGRLQSLAGSVRVLSIGSTQRRKNLDLLPGVFESLSSSGLRAQLLRVGEPLPGPLRARLAGVLGGQGLIELGMLEADALWEVYRASDVLLLPSTLEGFGLPVLEAMAAGCPVVSGDAASLREAGGDAALYFAPSNAREAAAQVVRVVTDGGVREDLVVRGRRRADEFSWDRHLDGVIAVYREVAAIGRDGERQPLSTAKPRSFQPRQPPSIE